MTPHITSRFVLRRCLPALVGLMLLSGAGIYFFHVSAQTEKIDAPGAQNLVNGRIAYTRQITQMSQERFVETADADGGNRVTLPTESMSNFATEPAWSPDGTRVAFAMGIGTTDIWVGTSIGNGLANLTNTGSSIEERNPSWSASGKIAYERRITQSGTPQIWIMNEQGGEQAHFAVITQPSPTHPAWSPDGLKLAFVSGGEIWVINANGTNEVRLTTNATADADPAWSPDGLKDRICARINRPRYNRRERYERNSFDKRERHAAGMVTRWNQDRLQRSRWSFGNGFKRRKPCSDTQ